MWGYAEAMRGKLNVPLARLIPPARLSARGNRSRQRLGTNFVANSDFSWVG